MLSNAISNWSTLTFSLLLPYGCRMALCNRTRNAVLSSRTDTSDSSSASMASSSLPRAANSWRGRTPIRLTHLTRCRVFKALRKQLARRRWCETQRDVLQLSPGQVPACSTATPPRDLRIDALVIALADQVAEEGAFLIRETELGPEALFTIVARMTLDSDADRERAYQRLERVGSRSRKRLREVVADPRI